MWGENDDIPSGGYKIRNQAEVHFLTFTVVEWIDVFTRKQYRQILLDSIKYCQQAKGLKIYAWCLMSNHLHLIASARNENLSDIIRDLKKYTSKKIVAAIRNNKEESRKEWMLKIFGEQGQKNSRNKEFQFWRHSNHPEELYSPKFVFQKRNYIHQNPVQAGIVEQPEHYLYSSARDYYLEKKCGLLEVCFI
jgi:putative transposase